MFTYPEISLRRKRQESFGGEIDIAELKNIFVIGVAKLGIVILLTDITIVGHDGIGGFPILVINPLI